MNIFKKLILKIFKKKVEEQLGLYEGGLMETKKWYQSKTILGGIVVALVTIYQVITPVAGQFGVTLPVIPQGIVDIINVILGTTIVISRVTATTSIK